MKKYAFIAAALAFLAACATEIDTKYVTAMDSYVGQSETRLIEGMGVPDKVYKLDRGTKVVTYTSKAQRYVGGPGFDMCLGGFDNHFGYSACRGNYPSRIIPEYCDINFNIAGGKVTSWSQKGNSCPRVR